MTDTHTASPGGASPARVRPFKFRGRYFTAITLRIGSGPIDQGFFDALDRHLRQTPQFFEKAPMLIDVEEAGAEVGEANIKTLVSELRARRLLPFGILNATGRLAEAAAASGLILVEAGQDGPLRERAPTQEQVPSRSPEVTARAERVKAKFVGAAAAASPPPAPQNRVVTQPVRSGQVVIADQGDLIVIGPVSSGAELIAAGNIHVYGRLRGRAMAGAHGDESARIFCQALEAELVAIAGHYRTPDNYSDDVRGARVQVSLEDDTLHMSVLG
ncbi:hypothetical protein OCH239_16915 [Roseivivax halodurans JCM 10272]|uniref:Probable septum site-determining protein MinC n=1 Tax=Roseivivax halodurans JCM 10272 TaxID=1449350 RepID=X7ECG9_9RHOB|nr:septum site-determining protein MinC [Roseivivax halodurans]ETX12813.1 hypothetical protein OCH239_16915 [Roseivivax halodurans JCM 10272]